VQVVSGRIALFGAIHDVWPSAPVKVHEAGRLIRKGVMLHRGGPSVKDARSTTAEGTPERPALLECGRLVSLGQSGNPDLTVLI
jgi:hypothetical protein